MVLTESTLATSKARDRRSEHLTGAAQLAGGHAAIKLHFRPVSCMQEVNDMWKNCIVRSNLGIVACT